jgi:hypothetical protein
VLAFGRGNIETIGFQDFVDLSNLCFAFLPKTNVKGFGIDARTFHQTEHEATVIEKHGKAFVAALIRYAKIFFEKFRCCENIRHCEIDVIDFHAASFSRILRGWWKGGGF